MITLDPRQPPDDAGVIRDILKPRSVTIRDPSERQSYFSQPQFGMQLRVRMQGGIVLHHIVRLSNGVTMQAPPAWVTECPDGIVVPLRPIEGLVG